MNKILLKSTIPRNIIKNNTFSHLKHKNILLKNKIYITKPRLFRVTHSFNVDSIGEVSYYVLKDTLLFIFFYCSLQWFHYKKLREDDEKNN